MKHRQHIVIPKTESRLKENLDCYKFEMRDEDYREIDEMEMGVRLFDPKYFEYRKWHGVPYYE